MHLKRYLVLVMFLVSLRAYSEEKFGIEIYKGASVDSTLTDLAKESADKMQEGLPAENRIKFEQSVYTSSDSYDKVLAFYEEKFAMKAAAFNPESPSPLDPNGFAISQEVDLKDAVTSAKFFNPKLDPAKFEGKVKLALFNKPNMPMVSVMDKGLNWKDGSTISKTIISVTKQPELPKTQAPAVTTAPAQAPAPAAEKPAETTAPANK